MNLSLIKWDSRNQLLEHLSKTERSVLIGRDIESPSRFFSCRAISCVGDIELGVISNQPRGSVCCELLHNRNLLIIGHDQTVTVVNIDEGAIHLHERLDGIFFEFIIDESRNQVLTIHELGVVAICFEGHVRWLYSSPEILEDWQMISGSIRLNPMDEATVLVDLTSGVLVRSQS
jgi:hypothetical protein